MSRLLAAVLVTMGLVACEAGKGRDAIPNAASDGGDDDGGIAPVSDGATNPGAETGGVVTGDSGPRATACTAAPYVAYGATVTKLSANGASPPLPDAHVGFSTCAGFQLTTDASGKASTQLTQGIAVTPFYSADGALSALGAEIPATADVTTSLALLDHDVRTLIPGFARDGGDAAVVEVVLVADAAATAPCNATSGVTLSVTGHAEATVSYMGASWPTDPAVASITASTTGTRAFVGGVTGATKVAIEGTKSGCAVKLVTGSQTGNFQLLAGSITIGVATVTN